MWLRELNSREVDETAEPSIGEPLVESPVEEPAIEALTGAGAE